MQPRIILDEDEASKSSLIQELSGRTLVRAWVLPSNQGVAMSMSGGKFLLVNAVQSIGLEAVSIVVGDVVPNVDWSTLEELGQHPRLQELYGTAFTGFSGGVLAFGDLGFVVAWDGVHFVKKASAPY